LASAGLAFASAAGANPAVAAKPAAPGFPASAQTVAGAGARAPVAEGLAKIEGRPADAAQAAQWASVKIQSLSRQSGATMWTGTGFWLEGQKLALTNNHVATDAALNAKTRQLVAIDALGHKRAVKVVSVDLERDLAALEIEGDPIWRLPVKSDGLKVGESIEAAGFGLGLPFSVVSGRFAQSIGAGKSARLLSTTVSDGGVSGGPTVDESGRVVGINVASAGRGLALSVPIGEAERFLEEAQAIKKNHQEIWRLDRSEVGGIYEKQLDARNAAALDAFLGGPAEDTVKKRGGWQIPSPSTTSGIECADESEDSDEAGGTAIIGFKCAAVTAGWSIGDGTGGTSWSLGYRASIPQKGADRDWGKTVWSDMAGGFHCAREKFVENGHPGFGSVCITAGDPKSLVAKFFGSQKPSELTGLYQLSVSKVMFTKSGKTEIQFAADGLSPRGIKNALSRFKAIAWEEPRTKPIAPAAKESTKAAATNGGGK